MTDPQTPAVLVVDDEPEVRAALTAMLAHHGYEPIAAASGLEAVAACQTRLNDIAAAVLDVRMPEMDGPATLDALRAIAPQLPCVFVSGYIGDYTESDLLARGGFAVLGKPVTLAQLGNTIAAALGQGTSHRR